MKVVIAPNAFKESLSSVEAARIIGDALQAASRRFEPLLLPIGDGGDGTLDALLFSADGKVVEREVTGPTGASIRARLGLFRNGKVAFVEMAEASGLKLVPPEDRNPMHTTSYGTGELIRTALDLGAEEIIIGVGGSATVDGGIGALMALGIRFLDEDGKSVPLGGKGLLLVHQIDLSTRDPRLDQVKLTIAVDVRNPLLGEKGAARVYGPQKGATPEQVEMLDAGLRNLSERIKETTGVDVTGLPGGGAAGGIAASFYGLLGAQVRDGIDLVLDLVGFDEALRDAHWVITGEGKLDEQTPFGKGPAGVAQRARRRNLPVLALAGHIEDEARPALQAIGITASLSVLRRPVSLPDALGNARSFLYETAYELGRLIESLVEAERKGIWK